MNGYFDFGEYSIGDFSPVTIEAPPVPLDEMTEPRLKGYIVSLRGQCRLERMWQKAMGVKDESRLIKLAEMYREAQDYYAQFNQDLKERINSDQYVPVLRIDGKTW